MALTNLQRTPTSVSSTSAAHSGNHGFALTALTSLFFMWGFITCMNDILIPYLKNMFELSYTKAMLVQFCFFGAYFVVSMPAGRLVARLGYQRGIVMGLLVAATGAALFFPSASMASYWLFLLALFILASGITILQVAANPYVSVLGDPATASSRLTLTQAFNSLGTTIAPIVGGYLIFNHAVDSHAQAQLTGSEVQLPYLVLSGLLLLLAMTFGLLRLPQVESSAQAAHAKQSQASSVSLLHFPHLKFGALAIFAYVGAEVGIGSFLINFIGLSHIAGLSEGDAAQYIAYYFGGAMVGRFIGAWVMQKVDAAKVLAVHGLAAILLVSVAIVAKGSAAMWAIIGVGLCNSIMFPTIFSLSLQDLGAATSRGSGLLCLAIVGGAIVPLLQGMLADIASVQVSFLLPLLCYGVILFFGLKGCHLRAQPSN